jgi:tetratricopeptide (TPR) repeat protein
MRFRGLLTLVILGVWLAIAGGVRADDEDDYATTYNRARELHKDGKLREAEAEYIKAIEFAKRAFGAESDKTASTMGMLGHCYHDQAKYADAEAIFRTCLPIFEKTVGPDHRAVASTLNNLGYVCQKLGKLKESEALFRRCLATYERIVGPDDLIIADVAHDVGSVLTDQAKYSEAVTFHLRGLKIREKQLAPDHEDVGSSLNSLAVAYLYDGRYEDAEPFARRCLAIREKVHGPDHYIVGISARNLAMVYRNQAKYAAAEPLLQRVLAIREKVYGPESPDVAMVFNDLGMLHHAQGKYASAEPHFQRSIKILEKKPDADQALFAQTLNNLALLYSEQQRYGSAQTLYERSLPMLEKAYGPDHPMVGSGLNNLATMYLELGLTGMAAPLYERSLKISEKHEGHDHPNVSITLNNLALAYADLGKPAEAETLYRRCLKIAEGAFGPDHPFTSKAMFNLSRFLVDQGRVNDSIGVIERLRRSTRRFYLRELPYLSDADQNVLILANEGMNWQLSLSTGLDSKGPSDWAARSAEWSLNAKAISTEAQTLRARMDLEAGAGDRDILAELQRLRMAESALTQVADPKTAARRLELANQRSELEKRLAGKGGAAGRLGRPWIELAEVRSKIPSGTVLIDIAHYRPYRPAAKRGEKSWQPARYVAWVIGGTGPIQVVDLGDAAAIDLAVTGARRAVVQGAKRVTEVGEAKAAGEATEALQKLADLVVKPLQPHLKEVKSLILSPDSELWVASWAALPSTTGRLLIEDYSLRFVISGRDLVPVDQTTVKSTAAVVVADPDFDGTVNDRIAFTGGAGLGIIAGAEVHFDFASNGQLIVRAGSATGDVIGRGSWSMASDTIRMETERSIYTGRLDANRISGTRRIKDQPDSSDAWSARITPDGAMISTRALTRDAAKLGRVNRLPNTAVEAEAVSPKLSRLTNAPAKILLGRDATEAALRAVRNPRALILATHGFFLPSQEVDDDAIKQRSVSDTPAAVRAANAQYLESPLLRCGLLVAGCNHREQAKPGQDDGVLTGQEIVGMDLRGCELVVLSACDTGLGDVRNGEGVAGLRQAFQLAGAESVVASLWQVPDRDTALLMVSFFDNLAKGMSKAEALREAQLGRIADRRKRFGAAHPYFWAAFTVTGR